METYRWATFCKEKSDVSEVHGSVEYCVDFGDRKLLQFSVGNRNTCAYVWKAHWKFSLLRKCPHEIRYCSRLKRFKTDLAKCAGRMFLQAKATKSYEVRRSISNVQNDTSSGMM